MTSARRGEPYPGRDVAALAVGWACAVLGPPGQRREAGFWSGAASVVSALFPRHGTTVYDSHPDWDGLPAARTTAVLVEVVNLPALRAAAG